MSAINRLDAAIRAVCPTLGVSVGIFGDPASVRIDFDQAATVPQRAAAQAVVDAFDWSPALDDTFIAQQTKVEATNAIDYGDLQRGTVTERLIRALALVTLDEINALRANAGLATRTSAQLVTAIKAKIAATRE